MAVRLTRASAQYYTRTSFFSGAGNSFSISAWVYPTTLPAGGSSAYHNLFGMSASIVPSIWDNGGIQQWTIGTELNDFTSGVAAAAGTWVHLYFSRSGATKTLWVNGVQVATGSDAAAGSTTLEIGDWQTGTAPWDGRFSAVKVWDGYAGDIDDAKQEMLQTAPVRLANLRAFYPFDVASTADSYTAAQTLTATGTPTSELGPGLPWQLFQSDDDVLSAPSAGDIIQSFQTNAFQIGVFAPLVVTTLTFGDNTLNDVAGTEDTQIRQANPTDGYGADTDFDATKWTAGDFTSGLLRFTGPSASNIPPGSYIISASITLYCAGANAGTRTTEMRRTLRAWTEGGTGANEEANWTNYDSAPTAWGTAGGTNATDRVSTVSASIVTTNADLSTQVVFSGAQLTQDVQDFADGTITDLAWILEDAGGGPDFELRRFGSSEGEDTHRPYLTVSFLAGEAGHADLVGDAGVYTITGIAAILRAHRELVASGGSYAIGGTAAVPRARRELAANSGSYALTGPTASTQQYGRTSIGAATRPIQNLVKGISATIGADLAAGTCSIFAHFVGTGTAGGEFRAFVLTGTDFDTVVVQSDMRNDLSADGWYEFTGGTLASYAPTAGTAVVLAIGSTATGAPAISQDNAGLEGWSSQANITDVTPLTWGVPDGMIADVNRDYSIYLEGATTETVLRAHRELAASAGAYVITGTDATLSRPGREILADVGAYAITGTAAVLRAHRELLASAGSYGVTGTAATLRAHRELLASAGSYAVTGTSAALRARRELLALAGSYLITGTAATLQGARELLAAAGSIVITGTDATLTKNSIALTLDAQSGAFAITGTPAVLRAGRALMSDSGAWSISGVDAVLRGNRTLTASGGSVTVTGTAASLRRGLSLLGDSGIYTIAGTDAAFLLARVLLAEAGSVTIVGTDAILSAGVPVGPAPDVRRLDASAIDRMLLAIALDRQATPSAIERRQETSLP